MSYNLKDFLSFKLNINPFEELAFAGSSFSMQKKDLSHILLAENMENQSSDEKDIVNESIPGAHIEINEPKETLISKLSKKIADFFKPKPKVYRLGNNESLEIDGTLPGNPLGGFFGKIGAAIEKFTNKGKEIKEATTIKNEPQIISNHPVVQNNKVKSDPTLLNEGTPQKNPDIIIPKGPSERAQSSSYIQSTPTPTIAVEEVAVDGEDFLNDNKKNIAKVTDSLTTEQKTVAAKVNSQQVVTPVVEEKDDDYTK